MQIQINTDRNIEGDAGLTSHVSSTVEAALSRFAGHISRVEVHLSDENSSKKESKEDIRCMLEARITGKEPVAVTHEAATIHQAVDGALDKLTRLLDSTLGKQRDKRGRQASPGADTQESPETDA